MSARLAARLSAALLLFGTVSLSAAPLTESMKEVEAVRGLTFLHDVKNETVDRKEIPERLRAEMVRSMPYSLDDYTRILGALRLVDPKTPELMPKLLGLFESQILAFYDPLTHVYYSVRQPPPSGQSGLSAEQFEQLVAVHELTHALQDQRFRIGEHDEKIKADWDESLAYHAVIEGEASLVMMGSLLRTAGVKLDDLVKNEAMLDTISEAAAKQQTIDPATPPYFVKSLTFPYIDGLKFVIAVYRKGGWKAMDAVYANPPRSTREILHPDEYFARTGAAAKPAAASANVPAIAPVTVAAKSRLVTAEHLGEFHWAFLVGAENARGWRNDRVTVVDNEKKESTVLAETMWDDAARATAFADAYVAFLKKNGIEAQAVRDGARVKVAYGADAALIASFTGAKPAAPPAEKAVKPAA